jgi:hypothetical protein
MRDQMKQGLNLILMSPNKGNKIQNKFINLKSRQREDRGCMGWGQGGWWAKGDGGPRGMVGQGLGRFKTRGER